MWTCDAGTCCKIISTLRLVNAFIAACSGIFVCVSVCGKNKHRVHQQHGLLMVGRAILWVSSFIVLISTCHLKCHGVCLSVILLCYRITCWRFCSKKGIICAGPCICFVLVQDDLLLMGKKQTFVTLLRKVPQDCPCPYSWQWGYLHLQGEAYTCLNKLNVLILYQQDGFTIAWDLKFSKAGITNPKQVCNQIFRLIGFTQSSV